MRDKNHRSKIRITKRDSTKNSIYRQNLKNYKVRELPSDSGTMVKSIKGKDESFIPIEAINVSNRARNPSGSRDQKKSDRYSQEQVDQDTPPVDSSDETLGG